MNHSHLWDHKKELGNCIKCWERNQGRSTRQATKTILVQEFGDNEPKQIEVCSQCWGDIATKQFWRYLTEGTPPVGYQLPNFRPLSNRRASAILYLVQEFLQALPDAWEYCDSCEELYNSEDQYHLYTGSGCYCENCADGYGQKCSICDDGFLYESLVKIDELYYCKKHAEAKEVS